MSRVLFRIFSIILLLNLQVVKAEKVKEEKKTIAVNQFISHVALDAAYKGIEEGLKDRKMLPEKVNLVLANAQGNVSNSVQISKYQASIGADFMVAISTPSAQTNLKAKNAETILAFVAVSNPKLANLDNRDDVIGIASELPIEELIDMSLEVFPNMQTIGVIFNSGEINSIDTVSKLRLILKNKNIKLEEVSITNSNDIKNAMNKITPKVDLVYIPQDNIVVSALDSIASLAKAEKKPLISNDPSFLDKGVLIALGDDFFASGKKLANMISDLIENKELSCNIKNTDKKLKINYKMADILGINKESLKKIEEKFKNLEAK